MLQIAKSIGKALLSALLTETFVKEIIIFLLEKLAQRSTNDVDDKIVEMVKKALHKEEK